MSQTLNFNELAWKTPLHDSSYVDTGVFEYRPTDKYYNEIIDWLKTAIRTVWTSRTDNVTTKRLLMPDVPYHHVIAKYNHETKGISWLFREAGTYHI